MTASSASKSLLSEKSLAKCLFSLRDPDLDREWRSQPLIFPAFKSQVQIHRPLRFKL